MNKTITKYLVNFTFGDTEYSMEFDCQEHATDFYKSLEKGEAKSVYLKKVENIKAFLKID